MPKVNSKFIDSVSLTGEGVYNLNVLKDIKLPVLGQVDGDLVLKNLDAAKTFHFPVLHAVGQDFVIEGNERLRQISAPVLKRVGGDLRMTWNPDFELAPVPARIEIDDPEAIRIGSENIKPIFNLDIKENICSKIFKKTCFIYTAQKESFINSYIPFPQSFDNSFMGRG